MDKFFIVALSGFFVTNLVALAKMLRSLGRMEERFDLLWRWYLENHVDSELLGRRRYDQRPIYTAHDDAREEH